MYRIFRAKKNPPGDGGLEGSAAALVTIQIAFCLVTAIAPPCRAFPPLRGRLGICLAVLPGCAGSGIEPDRFRKGLGIYMPFENPTAMMSKGLDQGGRVGRPPTPASWRATPRQGQLALTVPKAKAIRKGRAELGTQG